MSVMDFAVLTLCSCGKGREWAGFLRTPNRMSYAAVGGPNQVVSASGRPREVVPKFVEIEGGPPPLLTVVVRKGGGKTKRRYRPWLPYPVRASFAGQPTWKQKTCPNRSPSPCGTSPALSKRVCWPCRLAWV